MLLSSLLAYSLAAPMCNVTPQTYEFSRKSKRYFHIFLIKRLHGKDRLILFLKIGYRHPHITFIISVIFKLKIPGCCDTWRFPGYNNYITTNYCSI